MGCRPWQRDTAKPVAQSGESGVAAPAGDARWENRSLHGGGGEGGGLPSGTRSRGLLLMQSQGATYLHAVLRLRVLGLLGDLGTVFLRVPNAQSCRGSSLQRSQSAGSGSGY